MCSSSRSRSRSRSRSSGNHKGAVEFSNQGWQNKQGSRLKERSYIHRVCLLLLHMRMIGVLMLVLVLQQQQQPIRKESRSRRSHCNHMCQKSCNRCRCTCSAQGCSRSLSQLHPRQRNRSVAQDDAAHEHLVVAYEQ
jgi:hypothetical protein